MDASDWVTAFVLTTCMSLCAGFGGYIGASSAQTRSITEMHTPTPKRMKRVCVHLGWDPKWGAVCLDDTVEETEP